MRQGITTRYHGPTNSKGSRVTATARKAKSYSDGSREPAMSLTDHWDHASNMDANHTRVAQLLAAKLGWSGLWIGGGCPDDSGYQYVNAGLTPSMIAGHTLKDHPLGREGIDWFFVAEQPREQAA